MKLSLAIKFNLVFVTIFAIGLTAAGIVADRVLQQQALDETRHDADVLISAAMPPPQTSSSGMTKM